MWKAYEYNPDPGPSCRTVFAFSSSLEMCKNTSLETEGQQVQGPIFPTDQGLIGILDLNKKMGFCGSLTISKNSV